MTDAQDCGLSSATIDVSCRNENRIRFGDRQQKGIASQFSATERGISRQLPETENGVIARYRQPYGVESELLAGYWMLAGGDVTGIVHDIV